MARRKEEVPVQELVLLGLLSEEPKHGYELKNAIGSRMADIARITPGTIYYTLRRLEEKGMVASEKGRNGNRPERTVYRLTDAGRGLFSELVRAALFAEERPYFTFDLGLYFAGHVDVALLAEAVREKIGQLEALGRRLEAVERENPGRWPFNLYYIKERARMNLEANRAWFASLERKVRMRLDDGRALPHPCPPGSRQEAGSPVLEEGRT